MRYLPLSAVFALAAASPALAQKFDKIHLKGGSAPLEGEIVDMNFKEVKYISKDSGIETSQASKDVREIEFDSDNKGFDYSDAEGRFKNNEFAEARDKFKKALLDPRASKPVKTQAARYMIVQCSYELGDWEGALRDAKQFVTEMSDSFYAKDVFFIWYQAARAKGATAEADAAIKEMERAAAKADEWKKSVELLRADLAEANKDYKGARTTYDRYVSDRDPQVQLDARLGVLRCMASLQDWGSLAGRADQYINEWKNKPNPPAKLMLGAYLGKGKALLFGEKKNKEALLELLRCAWDIAPRIGEQSREHAESLAHAAMASARFAAEQKEKEKKDQFRDRAHQLKGELNRRYGNGWDAMIDKEIGAIPK